MWAPLTPEPQGVLRCQESPISWTRGARANDFSKIPTLAALATYMLMGLTGRCAGLVPWRPLGGKYDPGAVGDRYHAISYAMYGVHITEVEEERRPSRTLSNRPLLSESPKNCRRSQAHRGDRLSAVPDQAQSAGFGSVVVRGSRRNPHRDFVHRRVAVQLTRVTSR